MTFIHPTAIMLLHHFYHIYADGQWKEPVSEHLRALKEFGLYENLKTFKIGFVGSQENIRQAHQFIQSLGFVYEIANEQPSGWEQVTQIPMHEFSKYNEGLMLYAHSKGASNPSAVNIRWRRSMIYWNVIRWQDAVNELSTRSHAYGCHWIAPLVSMPEHKFGNMMFGGTFFWMRCEVMARHPKPALTHRWEAEGFCGYGWHQQPYPIYDPAPYFPNVGPFADGWLTAGDDYKPEYYEPKFYHV